MGPAWPVKRAIMVLFVAVGLPGCVSQIGVMVRDVSEVDGRVLVERCRMEFVSGGIGGDSVRIVEDSCTRRWADGEAGAIPPAIQP